MLDNAALEEFIGQAWVDPAVFEMRPDYRALLVAVDGLVPGDSDEWSDAVLQQAEAHARKTLGGCSVGELPRVAAWREAYKAFGAKPQRTRNSLEALLRRAEVGLPRINRLTDIYNAVSILHQVPVGGEDVSGYVGPLRLIRATGTEPFDTASDGVAMTEYPELGEVVRCDEAGVTCRRWNWRQGHRTRLSENTTTGLFMLDALDTMDDNALHAAADALVDQLGSTTADVFSVRRVISATCTPAEKPLFSADDFDANSQNYALIL